MGNHLGLYSYQQESASPTNIQVRKNPVSPTTSAVVFFDIPPTAAGSFRVGSRDVEYGEDEIVEANDGFAVFNRLQPDHCYAFYVESMTSGGKYFSRDLIHTTAAATTSGVVPDGGSQMIKINSSGDIHFDASRPTSVRTNHDASSTTARNVINRANNVRFNTSEDQDNGQSEEDD